MPVTIPSGRRRPPVAPAASTTGRTGSTHGDSAVAAPAMSANSASSTMRIAVFYADCGVTDARRALTNAQSAVCALQAAQERLDHERVELRSGSVLELYACAADADSHPVATVRHHCLVGVCDGEDARLRWDLASGQAGRVATAVGALVARKH